MRYGKKNLVIVSIMILSTIILIYSIMIEPEIVTITNIEIQNASLAKVLGNKVVVQISDLHIRNIGKRERKVLEIVDQLQPDFIFLTGENIYWDVSYQPALKFLERLHAKVGIWGVMGDYDYKNSRQSCLFCHEPDSGRIDTHKNVHFLRNSFEEIEVGAHSIRFGGIDNYQTEGIKRAVFNSQITSPIPTLILCHNPLEFDALQQYSEVMMLSGDTHGGQLPLPSFLWRLIGYEKNAKYNYGLFRIGTNQLFVSRGIGFSHVPIRFCRKPEVVLIKFVSNQLK